MLHPQTGLPITGAETQGSSSSIEIFSEFSEADRRVTMGVVVSNI